MYGASTLYHRQAVGPFVIDDTFIFLRYAEHLAAGEGPVFNPGERVEGYTSFLWVVLLAAAKSVGLPILLFAKVAGALLGALTLLASWRIAHHLLPTSPGLALLAPAWLATNRTFTAWATQGMDTKLFGALVATGLWLWLRALEAPRRRWPLVGLCLGLAALARPEGWLLAAVLGLGTLFAPGARRARSTWVREVVAFAALVGPHLIFRVLYYGDIVPNTFHAKVAGPAVGQGLAWLQAAVSANYALPYAGLGLLGIAALLRDPTRRVAAGTCLTFFGLYLAYLVAIGGDYFELRFLDPLLPLWALWTTAGVVALLGLLGTRSALARGVAAAACALVLASNARTLVSGFESRPGIASIEQECRFTAGYVAIGLWLRANLPAHESIALRPAGAIPYLSGARTLDLLGLNDREIATRADFVIEGVVGHQRRVGRDYARTRGITYWLGQPALSPRDLGSDARVSVELSPGLWFSFEPLDAEARFEPGSYRLGEHAGQAPRPF